MATEAVFKALIDAKYESNMRKVLAGDKRAFKRFTKDIAVERKKLQKLGLVGGGNVSATPRSIRMLRSVERLNKEQDKIEKRKARNLKNRKRLIQQEQRAAERFRLQAGLSMMFGGMALQRAVAPVTRGGLQDLGISDLFQEAAADIGRTTLLDTGAFDALLKIGTGIFDLPDAIKDTIGTIAFTADVAGGVASAVGQLGLAGLGRGALGKLGGVGKLLGPLFGAGGVAGAAGVTEGATGAAIGGLTVGTLSLGTVATVVIGAIASELISDAIIDMLPTSEDTKKLLDKFLGAGVIIPGSIDIPKALIRISEAVMSSEGGESFWDKIKKFFGLDGEPGVKPTLVLPSNNRSGGNPLVPGKGASLTRIERAATRREGNQVINDNANINITINGVSQEERPAVFRRIAEQALAGRRAQRFLSARFRR